jgi:hypothetical protein
MYLQDNAEKPGKKKKAKMGMLDSIKFLVRQRYVLPHRSV